MEVRMTGDEVYLRVLGSGLGGRDKLLLLGYLAARAGRALGARHHVESDAEVGGLVRPRGRRCLGVGGELVVVVDRRSAGSDR
jgi:hypothetical protein